MKRLIEHHQAYNITIFITSRTTSIPREIEKYITYTFVLAIERSNLEDTINRVMSVSDISGIISTSSNIYAQVV
jgi:hypothetical protein